MAARPTKFTEVTISGSLSVGGTTIVLGVINDNVTIAATKALAVTTADKLTVGGLIIPQTALHGGFAAAPADLGIFVTVKGAWELVSFRMRHATPETTAGTLTAMLKKVASGTALASGTDMLAAGLNMKAAADTNQTATLHGTAGNKQLADGNSIGILLSASATELAGISYTVELKRI